MLSVEKRRTAEWSKFFDCGFGATRSIAFNARPFKRGQANLKNVTLETDSSPRL
jgi:hypothetical protein